MFGETANTDASSSGYPIFGLSDTGIRSTDGYYHSGPMLPGNYTVLYIDHQRGVTVNAGLNISRPGETVHIHLDRENFGLPTEVVRN